MATCCCIEMPLQGIDLIFFNLLLIYPIVISVFNVIEKAEQFKNEGKSLCFPFSYPGYGMVVYNTNQLIQIRNSLPCVSLPQILDDIGHLKTDLPTNRTRILRLLFMAYYKIFKQVCAVEYNVQLAYSYKNTGKNMCYRFTNDIITCSPFAAESKVYTCNQLNVFATLWMSPCNREVPDVFNLNDCSCNCPDEDCPECPDDFCDCDPFDSIIEPTEFYRRINMCQPCNVKTICDDRKVDPLCENCCYHVPAKNQL